MTLRSIAVDIFYRFKRHLANAICWIQFKLPKSNGPNEVKERKKIMNI